MSAGAPTRDSTCCAGIPGLSDSKLAQPAARTAASGAICSVARGFIDGSFARGPGAVLHVLIEEQDLFEPLRASDGSRGPVERNVEEHRVPLVVAPGPDLFVARAEGPDFAGPAE